MSRKKKVTFLADIPAKAFTPPLIGLNGHTRKN